MKASNEPVQRRRGHVSSAPHVHNEMAHLRRASDAVWPSAATGCYTAGTAHYFFRSSITLPSVTPAGVLSTLLISAGETFHLCPSSVIAVTVLRL